MVALAEIKDKKEAAARVALNDKVALGLLASLAIVPTVVTDCTINVSRKYSVPPHM